MTGENYIGKFNPNDNDTIKEIKELGARLHDIIEAQLVTGRMTAATKTAAQIANKNACMLAVSLIFLPKED